MEERLVQRSCEDFSRDVASRVSSPAGGAVVAYAASLGVALASMAAEFTLGKSRYAAVEAEVRQALEGLERIRVRLVELVDEDARALEPLTRAYALPVADPLRSEALEEAGRGACAVPLELMGLVGRALPWLELLGERGSRLLVSDVGCAAALCRASLEAASLNVYVNTRSLARRDVADELDASCDALLAEWVPRAGALLQSVESTLRERG